MDVFDHGADHLPAYVLFVERAELLHDITCTDISDSWYAWLAAPPVLD